MATKAQRRVTRDDFEELLQSGGTRQLATLGRRLDDLGATPVRTRTRSSSNASDATTSSLAPSPMTSPGKLHPSMYEPAAELDYPSSSLETKRRSVYRSVGTASSPDLATLVRTTKERRAAEAAQQQAEQRLDSVAAAAPPSTPIDGAMVQPSPADLRTVAGPLSPIAQSPNANLTPPLAHVNSPRSRIPSPSLHVPSPAHPGRQRSASGGPGSSVFSRESNGRDSFIHVARDTPSAPEWASPAIGSAPPPGSMGARRGVPLAVENEPIAALQSSKPLFQNTMRRTSGFFKRKMASMGAGPRGPGGVSAPTTPVMAVFDQGSPPPPVPTIPTSYAPAPHRADSTRLRRPSAPDTARSRSPSREPPLPPPIPSSMTAEAGPSRTPAHTDTIRTGASQAPMHDPSIPLGPQSSWSLDWDGVMAGIRADERAPSTGKRAESAPTTPMPSAGTRERLTQSAKGKERQPLPQPPLPSGGPSASSSLTIEAPDQATPTRATRSPAMLTPSLSLADNDDEGEMPQLRSLGSPALPPKDDPLMSEPAAKTVADGIGLGLGLDTIREAHSRETSTTTRATPETRLPQLITQSPSPTPARPLQQLLTTASPTKRAGARQSVVGYPIASGSSVSLQRGYSRGSELSGEEAVTPDINIEERAVELATRCWDEDESFLRREKVAEWLGGHGRLNKLALKFYLARFDFTGFRLDLAFRKLCEKLYLKAETQQVDRILVEFSARYWANNPNAVYGSADVVHIVTYTLLLLNTDLHVVETNSRMSRSQFVRNAMSGIQASHVQAAPDPPPEPSPQLDDRASIHTTNQDTLTRASIDRVRDAFSPRSRAKRSGSVASHRSGSQRDLLLVSAASLGASPAPSPAVSPVKSRKNSFALSADQPAVMSRQWQSDMETLLKDMYNAIRDRPVFQPSAPSSSLNLPETNNAGLSPSSPYSTWAASRTNSSRRSQISINSSKRTSIIGGIGRSASPTPSMATSFSEGHSATTAYGSSLFSPLSTHSTATSGGMGFASNLSHTIIRESQAEQDDDEGSMSGASVSDEELALLGAPWAKEGILQRKHYWEAPHRRSKDKEWMGVFVVIQRGELKMFRFGQTSSRAASSGGGFGGGNWLNNASLVGELSLTHALCTAMPAPGYNKQRPHVFVLTLASGSSYFFEAGTADLVNEWVSTCNYWSGRFSKEPLTGGVSNMEYGWNRVVLPGDDRSRQSYDRNGGGDMDDEDGDEHEELASLRSGKSGRSRASRTSRASVHSAFAHLSSAGSAHHNASVHSVNPNDRIFINEWRAPAPPKVPSTLPEEQQLDALKRYLRHLGRELERHGEVRKPMNALYSSRSANVRKAQENWTRKQQHLTEETVKFSTYIDALWAAIRLKQTKLAERTVADMLETADEAGDADSDPAAAVAPSPTIGRHSIAASSYEGAVATDEGEAREPTTPSPTAVFSPLPVVRPTMHHPRYSAASMATTSDVFVDAPAAHSDPNSPPP